ncbi:MAG: carboxypeptidase regulatory-like domain-containing protein [Alphaproteobacteria bacterium]|nr:carboxypeptidase regulatory-like domain-containing protein [Alphaproteobacteria bacterium]MCB9699274.1 carboxypeptidase regulatory-like domain-containing protein [Alphaproteobacteria bacterium]
MVVALALWMVLPAMAQDAPNEAPSEDTPTDDTLPAPEEAPTPDAAPEVVAEPEPELPTTGIVTGVVTDPDGLPFPGITLRVGETDVITDADGRFSLDLPPGSYDVTLKSAGWFAPGDLVASVAAGQRTTVDIPLRLDDADVYELVVYAPEVVGGIDASIDQRKESAAVTEVIGAEQMSKSGDSNATSALARVTGLTIVDGRYVYVRGLGDRYASSLLNLSTLPSPEPERRVVPLDLFPTGLLDSVTVYKTWQPDLPGDFGGGVVSLKTRGIPERPFQQVTITSGYVAQTSFANAAHGYVGPTDFLGFGGSVRALPEPLAQATSGSELVEGDLFNAGFTPEQLEQIGESIDATHWGTGESTLPPDLGIQAAFGRKLELGGPRLGVFGGLTYNNGWSLDQYRENTWDVGAGGALELQNGYDFVELGNQILLGGLMNVGLEFNEQHAIYSTTTLTRSSEATNRTYQGFNGDVGTDIRVNRSQWVERQLLLEQVRGEHTFVPLGHAHVEWRYAFSTALRDAPDQREDRYDLEESTGQWLISDRPEGNGIQYSHLSDLNHDARLDLSLPFGPEGQRSELKAGGAAAFRNRSVDTRRFGYFERSAIDPDDRTLTSDQLFDAEHIGTDGYELRETTRSTDNYTAEQQLQAAYLMTDFDFGSPAPNARGLRNLSVLAGARVEHSLQRVTTFELFNPDATPIVADLDTTDVLPAVTVTQGLLPAPVEPTDDVVQVRAGWARTVSRPDFRELSPAPFSDVTGGREVFGNPELQRALIDHVDARIEWYPRSGELASVGAFYKHFQDPIESVVVPSATLSSTWENATSAENYGIEADVRKTMFGLGVPFLDHVYVAANGSVIHSRVDLQDSGGVQTSDERALQGQSPWVANLQLGYDDSDRRSIATVSFNMAGRRIVEVGAQGAPDTYEEAVPRLDLLLQQGFARGWAVRLRGRNLLDPNIRITQGDQVVREGRAGWSALASLEWRP